MRIVLRSRYTLEFSACHQFTCQDACASLDTLTAIVGELHLFLIEVDAVAEDGEDRTCTHDVGEKGLIDVVYTECVNFMKHIRMMNLC